MNSKFNWKLHISLSLIAAMTSLLVDLVAFVNKSYYLLPSRGNPSHVFDLWVRHHLPNLIVISVPIICVVYLLTAYLYHKYKIFLDRKRLFLEPSPPAEPLPDDNQVWPPPPSIPR